MDNPTLWMLFFAAGLGTFWYGSLLSSFMAVPKR